MRHFQDVVDSSGDSPSHASTSVENDNDAVSDARNNPDGLNQRSVQRFNVSVSLENCPTLLINICAIITMKTVFTDIMTYHDPFLIVYIERFTNYFIRIFN